MLETQAVVVSVQGRQAVVESLQGGGCGKCDSAGGCGSGKLSSLFCSEPRRFLVRNDMNAGVGSVVQVVVEDGMLLRSALWMYMMPLILLVTGSMLGAQWVGEESRDACAALGGLLGLIIGFVWVKRWSTGKGALAVVQPAILP